MRWRVVSRFSRHFHLTLEHHASSPCYHLRLVKSVVAFTAPSGTCGSAFGTACADKLCCSLYGFCGTGSAYCGIGCQPSFGMCGVDPHSLVFAPDPRLYQVTNDHDFIDYDRFANKPVGMPQAWGQRCGKTFIRGHLEEIFDNFYMTPLWCLFLGGGAHRPLITSPINKRGGGGGSW